MKSVNVRTLRPDELELLGRLYRNAYRIDATTAAQWLKGIAPENTYVIADEARVLSAIQILPWRVVIGGRVLPMGGIGGVATWADQQGHGYASQLMAASLPRMRELGYAVSFLYPFSYRYYSRFGWALGGRRVTYANIRPCDLPRQKEVGRVRAVVTDIDWQRAADGYALGHSQFNCLVERAPAEWSQQKRRCEEQRYQCYVIEDGAGAVRGFFACEDVVLAPSQYETIVRDVVCADPAACRTLFAFAAALPLNVKRVTIVHAERPCLWPYFKEPVVETRIEPLFQARIVDVATACALRGYEPETDTEVVIGLRDEFAPWNEGCWHLRVRGATGTIDRTERAPEIELTIQQLSAVFTGCVDPLDLIGDGSQPAGAAPALAKLRQIFHDRPTNLFDFF
jgi:predicted acetyltransferase